MEQDLLIFPYSGTGKECLDCLNEHQQCIGFISDDTNLIGTNYQGIPIYSKEAFSLFKDAGILLVHGSPASFVKRPEIIEQLAIDNRRLATIIHPKAFVSKYATIGKNVVVMAGVSIGPDAIIEDHVIILPNSTIHHDSIIRKHTLICGNVLVAGNVEIEANCYIGAGCSIKNGVQIGSSTLIGIGSVVTKNIPSSEVWFGNQAKKYERE